MSLTTPLLGAAFVEGGGTGAAVAAPPEEPLPDTRQRADDFTSVLAQRKEEEQQEPAIVEAQESTERGRGNGGGGGSGGLGAEVEALLGGVDHFPSLLAELLSAPTQVLLPGDVNPNDASSLQAASGCSFEEALRLIDCLAVVKVAADALAEPEPAPELEPEREEPEPPQPEVEGERDVEETSEEVMGGGGEITADVGSEEDEAGKTAAKALAVQADVGGMEQAASAPAASVGSGGAAAVIVPSAAQLSRQLGNLAGLIQDYPGLRTAAMARGAPTLLLRVLLRHPERAAAANAALALAALSAGPPPHKTSLIAGGVMNGLLEALQGKTATHAANGGDAPGVSANAANAVANLANGHTAGAAAIAAGGGIGVVLELLAVDQASNVRTNAAGILVQLTGLHEAYRAAIVAAGGVAALAAGLLRGPDAPACNSALALYNLAGLTPPHLRPQMAAAEGPLAISQKLMLCMSGRNAAGFSEESVAASPNARVNASAILLELCKDPAAAPLLADQAIPAALAALAAGRLPVLPPAVAASVAADVLSAGVELLYPVPTVVRGNSLLCLMALARMGPSMQLELGRCGALGTLLELIAPGQEPSMQVNAANAICSLAAANPTIHAALVTARCVPLMAGLLLEGGDAARANVCSVFVTMVHDIEARNQLQECGGLSSLVRMTAAIMDQRQSSGVVGSSAADPGGVLCNAVGALAEAAKYPDLRQALMQVEFGECLGTLLRCVRDAPEPAQVNGTAALCHLCREQACAVQLARLNGEAILRETAGQSGEGAASAGAPGSSARLRHNAARALARLEDQVAAIEAAAAAAAEAKSPAGGTAPGPPGGDESSHTLIHVMPRQVWEDAGPPAGGTPEQVAARAQLWDDGEDELSTVITPPLPLGAY